MSEESTECYWVTGTRADNYTLCPDLPGVCCKHGDNCLGSMLCQDAQNHGHLYRGACNTKNWAKDDEKCPYLCTDWYGPGKDNKEGEQTVVKCEGPAEDDEEKTVEWWHCNNQGHLEVECPTTSEFWQVFTLDSIAWLTYGVAEPASWAASTPSEIVSSTGALGSSTVTSPGLSQETAPSQPETGPESATNVGLVAGLSVGMTALAAVLAAIAFIFVRKRRQRQGQAAAGRHDHDKDFFAANTPGGATAATPPAYAALNHSKSQGATPELPANEREVTTPELSVDQGAVHGHGYLPLANPPYSPSGSPSPNAPGYAMPQASGTKDMTNIQPVYSSYNGPEASELPGVREPVVSELPVGHEVQKPPA